MVQDGGKKKKNKNRNKKKQNEGEQAPQQHQEPRVAPFAVPEIASISTPPPPASVPAFEKKPVNGMTNGFVKNTNINNHEVVLKGLAAEASHWMNYNWSAIQDAEAKYQTYLAANKKAARKTEKKEEDFDLFASDEEPAAKPAKTGKKAAKKQENAQPKSRTTSECEKKGKSRTTSESDKKKQRTVSVSESKKKTQKSVKSQPTTYLNVKNDEKTLVLLKPDAVHRNLMGDIICKFEERGFKLAAMKFVSASEDLLKNHYADLAKKPFFPELVRYMRSGPIVAMVWTGLNIIPMVRAMVGATRPMDAAPGSIRGDLCVDVGRNLIHASDSVEAAQKEVKMWFPNTEIVEWRPVALEWTYEDEVVEDQDVIEAVLVIEISANHP